MTAKEKHIRVLLAQFPLETHTKGFLAVASILRDAGMEVILLGNALPQEIVQAAVQEDADVIGISSYCGGELALGEKLVSEAKKAGIMGNTVFVLGGIFPPANASKLAELGFAATFPPSSTSKEITGGIKKAVESLQS